MPREMSVAGVPALWSNGFPGQFCAPPHPSPVQQECSPLPQAPQHERQSPPAYRQARNTFEGLAACTHERQEAHPTDYAHHRHWQPQSNTRGLAASERDYHEPSIPAQTHRGEHYPASPYQQQSQNLFASLAALSPGHHEAPILANAPEAEWHPIPPQTMQQPRNAIEGLAARSRHLNERPQPGSSAPGQPVSGQWAPAGNQTGGSSRAVHGVTLRHDLPQHQQSEWMGQQPPTEDPHGAQNPREASFSFARAGVALPPEEAGAQTSLPSRAYPSQWGSAQQPQSQVARPVPASFQPAPRTWPAHAQQHAGFSERLPQQQAGTARQPGQDLGTSRGLHADAAHAGAACAPRAPGYMAADQAEGQPQEPAQAEPQGFYNTWLQNLTTSMPVHWPGVPASRTPSTARAPSVAQGLHEPSQGWTSQAEAVAAGMGSTPAEVPPAQARAPAPVHSALSAHPGQAQEQQPGLLP